MARFFTGHCWKRWLSSVMVLVCFAATGAADDTAKNHDAAAQQLADRIDALIEERAKADGIVLAPDASDAEFFRRVSLDLAGRIPPASAVRDFLMDTSPDKRARAIDKLLDSPTYVVNATNRWRDALIPEAGTDEILRRTAIPAFESWLRARIASNRNYAEIVREILTLPIDTPSAMNGMMTGATAISPVAFYQAKQARPEHLGAATSRLFLGVRLECAQCHDHPFDQWKQDQFWSYAAFFSEFQTQEGAQPPLSNLLKPGMKPHELKIPETDRVVRATFLAGSEPDWTASNDSARERLANWITSSENPWFAKAAANRIWAQMFGQGLVNPVDDFSSANPASHPELLDELGLSFAAHHHDLRFLTRAIALSKTYQRTSRLTDKSQEAPRTYARMSVRALTPEQMFDSLAQATGRFTFFDPEQPLNFSNDPTRQEFLETFTNDTESPVERQSTILQALTLMNGEFVTSATILRNSQTLSAVVEAPFLDTSEQIEALFLATLSRTPTAEELSRFRSHVESRPEADARKDAMADILWALLNSSEFALNH